MFDSRVIAAYIARQCDMRDIAYNNTKIQKLLYIAYGGMLAWKGKRICDEHPRAWQYGPVFPKVFNVIHKGRDIAAFPSPDDDKPENHPEIREIVAKTLDTFGGGSSSQLSAWSHKPGSPWDKVVNGGPNLEPAGLNSYIPDDFITEYFKERIVTYGR